VKKLAIALCFVVPAFAQDPCLETAKLNASASGAKTWNGTIGAEAGKVGGSGDDTYGVEAWTEAGGSATSLTWFGPNQGGGYAFKANWSASEDYLGRFGYYWGTNGKKWNALGDLCVDYNYTRSANGTGGSYSYIGIYGWTIGSSNSAEYYIVEDWFGNGQQQANNLGNNCQTHGNITVDGRTYQVVTCVRPQGSGCVGCNNQAFGQVFSIRQGMGTNSGHCGTISIKKHFDEWVKMTTEKSSQSPAKYIYDKTYESKFLVEAQGGNGSFEATYMKFSRTGNCGLVVPDGNYTLGLSTSPSTGGNVSKSPIASYYPSGSEVTVTATPESGWKFASWSGDATGTTNPLKVTMDKNKVITAKFTPDIDPDKNIVTNGTFTNTDSWKLNTGEGYGNSAGTFQAADNKATINVTTVGTNVWEPQLVQDGITLVEGMKYSLSFDASALANRKIHVLIQMAGDPYTTYFEDKEVSLTTKDSTFTYEFTMNEASDENGRFGFNFGQETGTISISNVKLNYIAGTDPILKNRIPLTNFSVRALGNKALHIEANSPTVVDIFDLKGKRAATLNVSGSQTVKLSLPSGVYFAKARGMNSVKFVLK